MTHVSIGEFAQASGLSAKALRLYDEMGLLVPVAVDPSSGYRRYAPEQLNRARLVARLRLAGMPLARIRVVADLASRSGRAAAAELTSYWRQVEADAASARSLVATLVSELDDLDDLDDKETKMSSTQQAADTASYLEQGCRADQQDAILVTDGVYAVADGVGGCPRDLARDVVGVVAALGGAGEDDPVRALDAAVARAAALVTEQYADHPDAATTLTALVVRDGQVVIAHVGDTRAYRVREGRLERLTRDHSVVQTLVDEGRLTPDEARADDRRVILNRAIAVGASSAPDLAVHAVEPGDRLVLTSDGVHAVVDAAVLTGLLVADAPPGDVAASVRDAVRAAGEPDNHALVVVDLP